MRARGGVETHPFGAWPSEVGAGRVAAAALRLGQPRFDGARLHWLEGRPAEAGRQVVVCVEPGRSPWDLTPAGVDARSQVHEYGGGDYAVQSGVLVHALRGEGAVLATRAGRGPLRGTRAGARYADFALAPDGRFVVAVEEEPRADREPVNRLVAFELASGARRVLDEAHDFVSSPVFAPSGEQLAWLCWEHPAMPWDETTLCCAAFGAGGLAGAPRAVAGGRGESIFQPGFSPGGVLTFVSDRGGWWNLCQERAGARAALAAGPAEFGRAQWQLGMSSYGFEAEHHLLAVARRAGRDRLLRVDTRDGQGVEIPLPYGVIDDLAVSAGRAAFIGAAPDRPPAVCELELATGRVREHRSAFALDWDAAGIAHPEPLEFAGAAGETSYAFLYRPRHPHCVGPAGARPPLVVRCHGGPTAASSAALDPSVQFWTSRGFAVADVDYGGSTGYGRAYRERLRERWGIVDVDDCAAAARALAADGSVDGARLAIRGGSAGGFTALCALAFRDVFHAGCSRYGVADLEALLRDTHKFEARYLDGLVGPWPAERERYRARSPAHHADRLARPVVFFQGLEDRVVPPSQSEGLRAALRARGVPHAYVAFAGEQHGFRRADSIRIALEGELWFYARVFGFPAPVCPPELRIEPATLAAP